jgi:hypothetical protein
MEQQANEYKGTHAFQVSSLGKVSVLIHNKGHLLITSLKRLEAYIGSGLHSGLSLHIPASYPPFLFNCLNLPPSS